MAPGMLKSIMVVVLALTLSGHASAQQNEGLVAEAETLLEKLDLLKPLPSGAGQGSSMAPVRGVGDVRSAIKSYQARRGLPADGEITPALVVQMREDVAHPKATLCASMDLTCYTKFAENGDLLGMKGAAAVSEFRNITSGTDLMEAFKWWRILQVYGETSADDYLDKLKDRMRVWQVEEAEGRAARWLKRFKQ